MSEFRPAFLLVLRHEGGYSNDPDDPGGVTKYGISHAAFPDIDVPNLTLEQASEIYFDRFWQPYHLSDLKNQHIADFIFDLLVNMGPRHDAQIVQRACNELGRLGFVKVDGIMGPATIAAINSLAEAPLKKAIARQAEYYYESLDRPKYIGGWLNRVRDDLENA